VEVGLNSFLYPEGKVGFEREGEHSFLFCDQGGKGGKGKGPGLDFAPIPVQKAAIAWRISPKQKLIKREGKRRGGPPNSPSEDGRRGRGGKKQFRVKLSRREKRKLLKGKLGLLQRGGKLFYGL